MSDRQEPMSVPLPSRLRWTIGRRLVALFLVSACALVGIALFWIAFEFREKEKGARREVRALARHAAGEVGEFLDAVERTLRTLALAPAVRDRQPGPAERFLREALPSYPFFENLFAYTADDRLVATVVPAPPGPPPHAADRPWFQEVLKGRRAVGGFQIGRVTGKPVAIVALPMKNRQGRVVGVLGASLRLRALAPVLHAARDFAEATATLVDAGGTVLLHSEEPQPWIGKPLPDAPFLRDLRAGKSGDAEGTLAPGGPTLILGYASVPGATWGVVTGIPRARIARHVREEMLAILLPAAAILLLASTVGFAIARGTWRPLRRLAESVRGISGTGGPQPVPAEGWGEVAVLAEEFNRLLERLKDAERDREAHYREAVARGERLAEQTRRLQALYRAATAVSAELSIEALLPLLVREARLLVGARYAALAVADAAGRIARLIPDGLSPEEEARLTDLPQGLGLLGESLRADRPLRVDDIGAHPAAHGFPPGHPPMRTFLGAPIIFGGKRLGSFYLTEKEGGQPFTQEDEDLVAAFAAEAAVALENARTAERLGEGTRFHRALADLASAVASTLDLREVLRTACQGMVSVLQVSGAYLWLFDEPAGELAAAAAFGHKAELFAELRIPLHTKDSLTAHVARTRRPQVVDDAAASDLVSAELAARFESRSLLALPLLVGERLVGVVILSDTRLRRFAEEVVDKARVLAGPVAVAIENARLFADALQKTRRLEGLFRTATRIAGAFEMEGLLSGIAEEAARLMGVEGAGFRLLEGDRLVARGKYGLAHQVMVRPVLRVGESLSGLAVEESRAIAVPDLGEDPLYLPEHKRAALEHGVRGFLTVPLRHGDRVIGALNLYAAARRVFDEKDIELVAALADHAAVAIEKARLHEAVRRHAADLEARVQERTRELAEALRVKSEFLTTMSHELRTPLNPIIGFSEVLLEGGVGPLNDKQRRYASNIHRAGKRLLALIDDVLDFAAADAGRTALARDPIEVADLVKGALALKREAAGTKGVTLGAEVPSALRLIGDPGLLTRALAHLVDNAVKFTPAGGRVTIFARMLEHEGPGEEEAQGRSVEIAVADTGIGISAEDLPWLFRPFGQLDSSLGREYQGTGLGLALAKRVVELHRGTIRAESPGPGQGATFTVRLPTTPPEAG